VKTRSAGSILKLSSEERERIYSHDLEFLNRFADELNAEVEETLKY